MGNGGDRAVLQDKSPIVPRGGRGAKHGQIEYGPRRHSREEPGTGRERADSGTPEAEECHHQGCHEQVGHLCKDGDSQEDATREGAPPED